MPPSLVDAGARTYWGKHAKRGVTALAVVKISRYSKMALGVPPPHAWVRVGSGTLEAERLPRKTRPEIRPVRNGNRTLPMGTIMAGIPRRVRPVSTDEQDVAAQRDALEAVGVSGEYRPPSEPVTGSRCRPPHEPLESPTDTRAASAGPCSPDRAPEAPSTVTGAVVGGSVVGTTGFDLEGHCWRSRQRRPRPVAQRPPFDGRLG